MTISRFLPLLSALFSACFVESCDSPTCNDVGCPTPYSIDFEASSWGQGKYTVELVVNGETGTCEVTLLLDAPSQSTCSMPGVYLGSMNIVPSGQQPGLGGLVFIFEPTRVDVTVKLNGATLGQPASFTPVYANTYPNGPDCSPCKVANDKLKL